jgi:hypothetical protein
MAEMRKRESSRRALGQVALVITLLFAALLATWAVARPNPSRCPTDPPAEALPCVLAETPNADFDPGSSLVVGADTGWGVAVLNLHSGWVPDWWVHLFNRVVLPLHGWSLLSTKGDSGWVMNTYCRANACLLFQTDSNISGYYVVAFPSSAMPDLPTQRP